MKEFIEKKKEEIEKEFEFLEEIRYETIDRRDVLKANTSDAKVTKFMYSTILSYFPSLFLCASVVGSGAFSFNNPLTPAMLSACLMSVGIGCVGQKVLSLYPKKKMKKFVNVDVNTNSEIIRKMVHYDIECAKIGGKQDVLREIYASLERKESVLKNYSDELIYMDKNANLSNEELEKNRQILQKGYDDKIKQLYVLISQEKLSSKFKTTRKKRYRIEEVLNKCIVCSIPLVFFLGIPLVLENVDSIYTFSEFLKFIGLAFSPAVVSSVITFPYFNKISNDMFKSFNELNDWLENDKLDVQPNKYYEEDLERRISLLVNELVELSLELQSVEYTLSKRELEEDRQQDVENDRTNDYSLQQENVTDRESEYDYDTDEVLSLTEDKGKTSGYCRKKTPRNR